MRRVARIPRAGPFPTAGSFTGSLVYTLASGGDRRKEQGQKVAAAQHDWRHFMPVRIERV